MTDDGLKRCSKRSVSQKKVTKRWRNEETKYLAQLAKLLPLSDHVSDNLSKCAILRMTTAYVKARQLAAITGGTCQALQEAHQMMDALDGFILTVYESGMILDVSEHIHKILGHNPHDVIGADINEFLLPDDIDNFQRHFNLHKEESPTNLCSGKTGNFTVRFKYKIANKDNKIRQTGYVNLQLCGVVKTAAVPSGGESILTVACYPFCLTPCKELDFFETCIVTRFDNSDRLTYMEEWGELIFGPNYKEYYYRDMNDYFHPEDVEQWAAIDKYFIQKGSLVMVYNILTNDGQLIEGVSRGSIIFGPKGERLFSVSVDYLVRRDKVCIKQWPVKTDMLFLFCNCWLPGENSTTWKSRLHEVADIYSVSRECSSPKTLPDITSSPALSLNTVGSLDSLLSDMEDSVTSVVDERHSDNILDFYMNSSSSSNSLLSDIESQSSQSQLPMSSPSTSLYISSKMPSDGERSLTSSSESESVSDILSGRDFLDFLNDGIEDLQNKVFEQIWTKNLITDDDVEDLQTDICDAIPSSKASTNATDSSEDILVQDIFDPFLQDHSHENDGFVIFDEFNFAEKFDIFQGQSDV